MDLDLSKQDIGQLENGQALTAFFARLGYDVDDAAKTPLNALGLDAEDITRQVLAAHRIGVDPEDGDIVVYLPWRSSTRGIGTSTMPTRSATPSGRRKSPALEW